MRRGSFRAAWPAIALLAAACSLEPSGERPGFGISGEVARTPVSDWSFTDDVEEILIETRAGYGLPHSVTIWCVSIDGELYVGASAPEFPKERRWVRNVRRDAIGCRRCSKRKSLSISASAIVTEAHSRQDGGNVKRLASSWCPAST